MMDKWNKWIKFDEVHLIKVNNENHWEDYQRWPIYLLLACLQIGWKVPLLFEFIFKVLESFSILFYSHFGGLMEPVSFESEKFSLGFSHLSDLDFEGLLCDSGLSLLIVLHFEHILKIWSTSAVNDGGDWRIPSSIGMKG